MNARDDLALEIFIADNDGQTREASLKDWKMLSTASTAYAHGIADGLIAAGWTKPRTITTAAEMDALPAGSTVVDSEPDVCVKTGSIWWRSGRDGDSYKSGSFDFPVTLVY